jgi:hypothetical protein
MKHRTLTLVTLLVVASAALALSRSATHAAARQRQRQPARPAAVDYSKFHHSIPQHQKACDTCHTSPTANWRQARAGDAAFPDITDYPDHDSCLECHRRQFFVGARPAICSVCHVNVSPRAGERFPFENPREAFSKSPKASRASEFALNFPHDRHQDVMARFPTPPASRAALFVRASFAPQETRPQFDSCTICHQTYEAQGDSKDEYVIKPPGELPVNDLKIEAFWLKKGMLKSSPTGHASCFNCHYQDGGERPLSSDCAGCHKPLPAGQSAEKKPPAHMDADPTNPSAKGITDPDVMRDWMRSRVARFRHEQSDHEGQYAKYGCAYCHITITGNNKISSDTLYVPIQTCATSSCHGGRTSHNIIYREVEQRKKPGGANYQCAYCHINYGKDPTPKTHSDLFSK